jgi:tRNA 2-thiouridine synthesizing protein A
MNQARAERVIDGRSMEPPEPFVQTMEALDTITPGQKILLIVGREPIPLYRALELNGFSWQTERLQDGSVEVLIWHRKS